jgi:hypothetical protein
MGFEQGVVHTVEHLLEEHQEDRQHLREMAQLLDQCIDQVTQMVNVGTGMQQKLIEMQRLRDQSEGLDNAD